MTKQQFSRNNIIAYSKCIDGEWYDFNCEGISYRLNTKCFFDQILINVKNKALESNEALNIILSETDKSIEQNKLDLMIMSLNKLSKFEPQLANEDLKSVV
jgi:hypothetical protein